MKPLPILGERLLLSLDWLAFLTGHYCSVARHRPNEPNPRGFAVGKQLEHFVKNRFPGLSLFADIYDGAESVKKELGNSVRLLLQANPELHRIELEAVDIFDSFGGAAWRNGYGEDLERFVRMVASGEITESDLS